MKLVKMSPFWITLSLLLVVLIFVYCTKSAKLPLAFDQLPVYEKDDLGLSYSPSASVFKVWSPLAEAMRIKIYQEGSGGAALDEWEMKLAEQGVWQIELPGDQKGRFYTFQIRLNGKWLNETPDPYAKAVGVNGLRAMVVDLKDTNPDGWDKDQKPPFLQATDAVIYELHFRDLSMHENSGIRQKGKFLGLTETGTVNTAGDPTGLDHLKDLGITHIHLLPSFDFKSIDESKPEDNVFNWGYDPQNYNVPEGSYATDPYNGISRIKEFKTVVQTLHEQGIRVILDVVYNHTFDTDHSNFNLLVPGYYYRQDTSGQFSNASACGNETASERYMMRKFMIESVKYWVEEYHIDGFRFDLMGIHDIETMNLISETLHKIEPGILIYGEGWTAGSSPLPDSLRALKANVPNLNGIAAFSDEIRDGIRGHVFTPTDKGFVSGNTALGESIKFGVAGAINHPEIDFSKVNYSKYGWAKNPDQTIVYASCHDNHTLWDRLAINSPEIKEAERIKLHQLSLTIVLTSQGIPFLHAGTEMLRTKFGVENSYNVPDSINAIDWDRKTSFKSVYQYIKGLVQLRKDHPAFRMQTAEMVSRHLKFIKTENDAVVAFLLEDNANGDAWKRIAVVYNADPQPVDIDISDGNWTLVADDQKVLVSGIRKINSGKIRVNGRSAAILFAD